MSRRPMIALLAVAATVACENMGLDYAGPADDAARRPPPALVAAVTPPPTPAGEGLIVDGRLWLPAGSPLALDEEDVRAVGSASGRTVYARAWDQPPYDRLFARDQRQDPAAGAPGSEAAAPQGSAADAQEGPWIAYLPVIGGGGRTGGSPNSHGATGEAGGH